MSSHIIELHNDDNILVCDYLKSHKVKFDFIYADMIYENLDFSWINSSAGLLKENSIFVVQTDYHTVAEVKLELDRRFNFVNWLIYLNDWGGTPKNKFAQKHDDILIYSNGDRWKWYPDRIQIPKATAGTAFDKKGTGLKTPPSVFYDKVSFSTTSKERVKYWGKGFSMQKPLWLMERLLLPFTDEKDSVLDLFMGTGTLGSVCRKYKRNYLGIESDKEIFNLAKERI